MLIIAKILLSVAAVTYGVLPLAADLSDSHLLHTDWPGHARFHLAWLLAVGAGISVYVAVLVWRPSQNQRQNLRHASVLGMLVLGAFFVALFTRSTFGGAIADPDHQVMVLSFDANVFIFSIAFAIQLIGAGLIWRAPTN